VEPVTYTVSCTTRDIRPGESDGSDYFFLSEGEFQRRIDAGEFLEHAVVHGRRYGTLKTQVLPHLAAGRDVIMDLDIQGAAQLRGCPDENIRRALVDVFIHVPDIGELKARLAGRRSETPEQLALRLANALGEMEHWHHYRYTLVSRSQEDDLREFRAILTAERHRSTRLSLPGSSQP
jgi:guanylate kinase